MTASGASRGASWADYDDDGDQDLYVTVNGAANILYRNNDNGTFTNVAASLGVADAGPGAGVAWGDVDGDQDLDLMVANDSAPNLLYLNEGGSFVEAAADAGLNLVATSKSPVLADIDKDGDLDLLLTTGVKVYYWVNDGAGLFTEVSSASGILDSSLGEGAAVADMDADGDLDYYIARSQFQANRLYENNGNIYHWFGVELTGRRSNRDAVGARVTVTVNGRSMVREVSGGSGLYSMNEKTQHFGLGAETVVDELRIEWPSGQVQIFTNIAGDQVLAVTERVTPKFRIASQF
jgi:hypothetical protein